jgi:hypothetical protein
MGLHGPLWGSFTFILNFQGCNVYTNNFQRPYNSTYYVIVLGARGSVVVKALCYKPEGRAFETR